MSRLIDENEVKELLLGLDSLPWEEEVDGIVDRIPTAYSVEAVVRELEAKSTVAAQKTFEAAEMGFERASIHYQGVQDGLDYAIEIVRGGRNE